MIKKFAALLMCFVMIQIPVLAVEFEFEENFEIDVWDVNVSGDSDEVVLMEEELPEITEEVKAKLEEKLIAAWENFESEVTLYPEVVVHSNQIAELFSSIFFEKPEYYYVARSFSGTKNSKGIMGKLTKLTYTITNKAEIEKTWAEIDKATEEILFYISPEMNDFEKIMTVHDYMDLHYVYDISDMDQTYLIMLDKRGVCTAYAEAFQHMMNVLGIECTLVKSDEMGHIWNMVMIEDRWYHADITWDDPTPDQYAEVCHKYMLLSEKAITELGHTGFTKPYYAGFWDYDDAPWHDDMSSLVTVGGVMYYNEGNNLIDEEGNIIYKDLDGGDGMWNVSKISGIPDEVFAGVCEVNNVLYFNTDTGIYSYNPQTEEVKCIREEYGICGLFADGNTIHYSEYDFDMGQFVKKGDLTVCGSFLKSAQYEGDKAVVRYYNDSENPVWVISGGENYKTHKIDPKSAGTAQFENGDNQTIFIWEQSLEPVTEKIELSK